MSAALISLFLTIGSCTWIYTKLQNRSGNNTKQSLTVTGIIAVLLFVFVLSILSLIFK